MTHERWKLQIKCFSFGSKQQQAKKINHNQAALCFNVFTLLSFIRALLIKLESSTPERKRKKIFWLDVFSQNYLQETFPFSSFSHWKLEKSRRKTFL